MKTSRVKGRPTSDISPPLSRLYFSETQTPPYTEASSMLLSVEGVLALSEVHNFENPFCCMKAPCDVDTQACICNKIQCNSEPSKSRSPHCATDVQTLLDHVNSSQNVFSDNDAQRMQRKPRK